MSFTLGVYELFAYIVPGILYLYVVNEFLKLFTLSYIEFKNFDNIAATVLFILFSYILGQLFDFIADKWRRWRQPKEGNLDSIERLKRHHPKSNVNFLPQDSAFLLSLIRRDYPDVATTADRSKALSKMLQNISLGLLFYTLFQLASFVLTGFSIGHLLIALLALIFGLLAKRRSQRYNRWYYDHIYETALTYGSDTDKIIKKIQSDRQKKKIN